MVGTLAVAKDHEDVCILLQSNKIVKDTSGIH